ncbi:class I adenylate-forming enzyme family protein [Virgibacillus senegalensis]|uniref:class I adenylate-forming enzyme family protein n=1 Tax=Virgibacillus senegalensis TaxID=1499679 RepID=UPI00069E613D|nr:class I adenylate-forming enzyme family protein [Virgibacillus senegalensis]
MTTLEQVCFAEENHNKTVISTFDKDFKVEDIHQLKQDFEKMLAGEADLTGKRVALLVPNTDAYIALVFAVNKLGGTVVPLSTQLREGDLSAILDSASPHIIFAIKHHQGKDFSGMISSWTSGSNLACNIYESNDGLEWTSWQSSGVSPAIDSFSRHFILFTSGSTGVPKGVVLSQEAIFTHIMIISRLINGRTGDRYLHLPPQTVAFGLVGILCAIKFGYRVAIPDAFDLPKITAMMKRITVTKMVGTPSLLRGLYNIAQHIQPEVLTVLEECYLAGEMIKEGDIKEFDLISRAKFIGIYGITEAGGIMTCDLRGNIEWGVDEVYQFKIVERELLLKSPALFTHYYQQPEITKEVLENDGWFHTGDIAELNEEGKVVLIGRKKDLIKKAGQQVIPGEIEKILEQHSKVAQAAVIGAPHAVYGEQIIAFVMAESGTEAQQLYNHCASRIAGYKVPDQVKLVNELPSISGKVDKTTLRKQFDSKEVMTSGRGSL